MKQFMLYVSEKDSKDIYPDNNPRAFAVQLPQILILEGQWSCCVKKVHLNTVNVIQAPLAICCDFCDENYHYGRNEQVLMDFILKSEGGWREYEPYCPDNYTSIKNNSLRIIRFRLDGDTTNVVSELRLHLHFKKENYGSRVG